MKLTAIVVLILFLNGVLCKELEPSAQTRNRRQINWAQLFNNGLQALGSLFIPNGGFGAGGTGPGGAVPGGVGTGGMNPGGMFPGGGGTGRQCDCRQITKRDADESDGLSKDLNPDPDADAAQNAADDDLTRVVGGQATRPNEYPSTVLVLYDGNQHCGGTLINSMNVLTAAHCVQGRSDATRFSVVAGAHNINNQERTRVTVPVAKAVYHPEYNTGGRYNKDVAILQLERPLPTNTPAIKATCLPRYQRNYDGLTALVVGWGKTSENGGASSILQHTMVPLLNNDQCSSMMENKYSITANMICAGYAQGGRDSCAGDSGGPLFRMGSAGPLQMGIVSFGEGCARQNRPGVYTRVDQVMDFIMANSPSQDECQVFTM